MLATVSKKEKPQIAYTCTHRHDVTYHTHTQTHNGLGEVVKSYTLGVDAGGPTPIQGYRWLHKGLEASPGYLRSCLK